MKERVSNRDHVSRTLESIPKSSNQKSLDNIIKDSLSNNRAFQKKENSVIQRIIVVGDNKGVDFGMIVNVYQMLKNGIDKRVTLLSVLAQSNIEGEQIGLQGHGHGPQGEFDKIKADVLAELLHKAGVNDTNTVIDLLSCNSGSGGNSSYAASFAAELKKQGIHSTVYANRGLGVTMDDGFVYSKKDRTPDLKEEYDQIFVECKEEREKAIDIAAQANEKLQSIVSSKESGAEKEKLIENVFLEFGKEIMDVAGNLFRRLYDHQRKILAPHDNVDRGLYIKQ